MDERYDGVSLVPVFEGRAQRSARPWILAMGGGNNAKVTEAGIENQYWFRDRVLRNERFKAFIGSERQLVKLVDLASSTPDRDVQHVDAPDVQATKRLFQKAVASMPPFDADPIYKPLEHRDWYLKPSAKSRVWKIGYPGSTDR